MRETVTEAGLQAPIVCLSADQRLNVRMPRGLGKNMKRLLAALILVALLAGPAMADLDLTFETVDEVERGFFDDWVFRVRGIPQGETEAVQVIANVVTTDQGGEVATACERMALLAVSRPGRYFFQIATRSDNPPRRETLYSCRLIRR
jgi:hypothetical protein